MIQNIREAIYLIMEKLSKELVPIPEIQLKPCSCHLCYS